LTRRPDRPAREGSSHNEISGGIFHDAVLQIGTNVGPVTINSQPAVPHFLADSANWPLVRDWDPVAAGAHPARPGPEDVGVPPYVPRDVDSVLRSQIAAANEHGGFVLVLGHSAAGKTRAAFEAVQVVLPGHRVAAPVSGADLAAILQTVTRVADQCLLWLDDLEFFLGPGALDQNVLAAFTRLRVPVVATMRMGPFSAFNPVARESQRGAASTSTRQIARIGARVLEMAHHIEVSRLWSDDEIHRARDCADERIVDAVGRHRVHGVAEYLAAGPAIWSELLRAGDVDGQPRGAALVAAAIDLARTGLEGPFPQEMIVDLHEHYLRERGGSLLRPEPLGEAWEWATRKRFGVTSPILPVAENRWRVFDYLVDRTEQLSSPRVVPDFIWRRTLDAATDAEMMNVAVRAAEAGTTASFEVAETIWRVLIDINDRDVEAMAAYNLGVLCVDNNRAEEAREFFIRAAENGEPTAAFNLSIISEQNGDVEEARDWNQKAVDMGYAPAFFRLGFDLEQQGRVDEAAQWYRQAAEAGYYRAATNLGNILSVKGNTDEAKLWFDRADAAGDHIATFNIGLLHHEAGRLDEAEHWYRLAIERGSVEAAFNLGTLRKDVGDRAEAENLYRDAADRGYVQASLTLARLLAAAGEAEAAESWYTHGAEAGHIPSIRLLSAMLYESGRLEEAEVWLKRAVDKGSREAAGALGQLLAELDRAEEAVPYLTTAAEDGDLESAYNLGTICVARGDLAQAQRWYRQAADGGDSEAAANLADVLFQEGRVASAVWWMRRHRTLERDAPNDGAADRPSQDGRM
jgi:uncharacterized protein